MSPGSLYTDRENICKRLDVTFSCDCCRTTALFGSKKAKKPRKGTAAELAYIDRVTKSLVKVLGGYKEVDYEIECNEPVLWDLLSDLGSEDKLRLWNKVFPSMGIDRSYLEPNPLYNADALYTTEDSEYPNEFERVFFDLSCTMGNTFIDAFKKEFEYFKQYIYQNAPKPSYRDARAHAIVEMYIPDTKKEQPRPVQLQLIA